MEKTFSDGAAVRFGWQTFKDNAGFLIGAMAVALIAVMIPLGLMAATENSEVLSLLFFILYYVVAIIVGIGGLKILLMLVDGEKPSIGDLFRHWHLFLNYLAVTILYGLIVMGGLLILVVPGIYWGLKFYFSYVLVVDKGMGPIEALKESARITEGVKWDLIGLYAVIGLVVVIGYLALFVGVLASVPVAGLATLYVYRKLEQQAGPAQVTAAPAQPQQPAQPQAPQA